MWISFVSLRLKLVEMHGRWIIWNMSPLEFLKGYFSTQSPFPNGLWARKIWRQTMELQQPTLEKRVLAIELPSGLQPLPRALNNPLNWFPTPIFIFASESRAIIDYDSWISLINNALRLSQLMYRIPPVHATHVQRHPKALKADDFLYRSFHPMRHP